MILLITIWKSKTLELRCCLLKHTQIDHCIRFWSWSIFHTAVLILCSQEEVAQKLRTECTREISWKRSWKEAWRAQQQSEQALNCISFFLFTEDQQGRQHFHLFSCFVVACSLLLSLCSTTSVVGYELFLWQEYYRFRNTWKIIYAPGGFT